MTDQVAPFDKTAHRRFQERAFPMSAEASFLVEAATQDVLLRLGAVVRDFPVAVDLTIHGGGMVSALASDPRVGRVIGCASSQTLCPAPDQKRAIVCDEEALPFAAGSLNLVTSILGLQWINDLPGALVQIRRALKPDGLFMAALIGGESLTELRQSLLTAEAEITGGAHARVSPFADLRDMGALLQRSGFALPVVDIEPLTVRYANPARLLDDLRAMGAQNALTGRSRAALRTLALTVQLQADPSRSREGNGPVFSFEACLKSR